MLEFHNTITIYILAITFIFKNKRAMPFLDRQ